MIMAMPPLRGAVGNAEPLPMCSIVPSKRLIAAKPLALCQADCPNLPEAADSSVRICAEIGSKYYCVRCAA